MRIRVGRNEIKLSRKALSILVQKPEARRTMQSTDHKGKVNELGKQPETKIKTIYTKNGCVC